MDISKHAVHVWMAETNWSNEQLVQGYQLLSSEEQKKADRFLVEHARKQHIAAHTILRKILAGYLECQPNAIQFQIAPHGKPFLQFPSDIEFNMSHSKQKVLIAVCRGHAVGIDIEQHDPKVKTIELAERFFSNSEVEELAGLDPHQQLSAFYRLWVLKEAFIKGTGQGLSFGLDKFVVTQRSNGMDCLLSTEGDVNLPQQWALGTILQSEQDYSAALAVYGSGFNIQFHHWLPKE